MHSIKNTIVAVILLGVSYGVYQVLTTPEPTEIDAELMQMISVDDNPMDSTDPNQRLLTGNQLQNDSAPARSYPGNNAAAIPEKLLDEGSQLPRVTTVQKSDSRQPNEFAARALPPGNRGGSFAESLPSSPTTTGNTYPGKSSAPQLLDIPHRDDALRQDMDKMDALKDEINPSSQFDSDSMVSSPRNNLTNVLPRPSNNDASLSMFGSAAATGSSSDVALKQAWPKIENMVADGQYRLALSELTGFYRSTTTTDDQLPKLLNWLDLLAAKVIYSSEHHLRTMPYIVQPDDKIADLAKRWLVPAQLIYNINRNKIGDPTNLVPGTELKMVQGPFDAEIDTTTGVMTLYVDQLYAGRFAIRPGSSVVPGEFGIVDKSARGNQQMPFWIGLTGGINMFGTREQNIGGTNIGLTPDEASDVFSILSASSTVRVLR